jgi:lactoylglutathione lyase
MKWFPRSAFVTLSVLTCLMTASAIPVHADDSEFSRPVIDMGVVVSDVDASVKFYTEVIGFKEMDGFKVPAGFSKDAGLTDEKPLDIRVLQLDEDENATKLKLMQLPGVKSKKSDNRFIHSQLGISYLTIFVEDMTKALDRLKKAGVKPVAKGPVALPEPLPRGVFLTVVRDPDGNLVELVGPKK